MVYRLGMFLFECFQDQFEIINIFQRPGIGNKLTAPVFEFRHRWLYNGLIK